MVDYYDIESIKNETFGHDLSQCKIIEDKGISIWESSVDSKGEKLGWSIVRHDNINREVFLLIFAYPQECRKIAIRYCKCQNAKSNFDNIALFINDFE